MMCDVPAGESIKARRTRRSGAIPGKKEYPGISRVHGHPRVKLSPLRKLLELQSGLLIGDKGTVIVVRLEQ
jgi:hypothetical protein